MLLLLKILFCCILPVTLRAQPDAREAEDTSTGSEMITSLSSALQRELNTAAKESKTAEAQNKKRKKKKRAVVEQAQKKEKKETTPQAPLVVSSPEQSIGLNFEKIKLSSFIEYATNLRKINIIPDKATDSIEVSSIAIRELLTPEGVWQVFLTTLEMYGFSIIEIGEPGEKANIHKIIPRSGKAKEPLPSYIGTPLNELPNSDINIRYLTFLHNITVNEVNGLLDGILGADHQLVAQPNVNGFIITDKALNIKSAMKIIEELDQSGLQETVVVRRLQRTNAAEVKQVLDKLISAPDQNPLARLLGKKSEGTLEYFSPTTKIVVEERSNSIILLGNHQSIKTIEDFITSYFESEERLSKSPLKMFEFQYAEATQVRDLLTEVVNSSPDTPAGKFGGVRGGVKYFKNMNFQVDERGNKLIVSCADPRDWKLLKPTLKALDTAQPSVAIETLIVSVNASDDKELGGQFRPKRMNTLGHNVGFQSAPLGSIISQKDDNGKPISLFGNLLEAVTGFGRGSTVLSFGNAATGNVWAVFKALKSETNASVISQPFITVANRVKAIIEIGDSRRIIKEEAVSDTGDIGANNAKSYMDQSASTHIEYTPQINLDGIINLQVNATVSDFTNANGGIEEKKVLTNVSVASGQVLVLGGFVKTTVNQSEAGTPVLSKLPIFGWLFKDKTRNIKKEYIFIFVCPTIIKPRQTPGVDLYTKMKLHDATDAIEAGVDTRRVKDPIHNWFFNPDGETYAHKVVDFATARYQPSTVDIKNDPEYRSNIARNEKKYGETYNPLDAPEHQALREPDLPIDKDVLTPGLKKHAPVATSEQRDRFKEVLIPETTIAPLVTPKPITQERFTPPDQTDSRNRLKDILSLGRVTKELA